ncbi:MAG: AAA family ATPase [Clostridia bacterium]|nr:AAA family ATPase [Clostridia bacterium]
MSNKNVLIVLCGLPASGKSTYAEMLVESGIFCSVCPDKIRGELYGDESIQGDGKQVFAIAHHRIKDLGQSGNNVVFDATNISCKNRKNLIKEMRPYFDVIICKWFSAPWKICDKRNMERERQVPYEVMERMALNFKEPTMDEGWDYIEEIKNY